jgi:hypothetical protein
MMGGKLAEGNTLLEPGIKKKQQQNKTKQNKQTNKQTKY